MPLLQILLGAFKSLTLMQKFLLNKDNTVSSFCTERNGNVYIYAFSGNVPDVIHSGRSLGYHYFQGNEQILLNFREQLTANVQVDVYAYCDAAVEQSSNVVKKNICSISI